MTAEEYNGLSEFEKMDIVWEHGEKISQRENDYQRIIVYRIDDLYVELSFFKNINSWPEARPLSLKMPVA